jgi:hypothetical protein
MFGIDTGPGQLTYVTRPVTGTMRRFETEFDEDEKKNIKRQVEIKDPVIIFLASGQTLVMSGAEAERRGFFEQPEIMQFEAVTDPKTAAGRYKFAMKMEDRLEAFRQLEAAVISRCISKHGHPLPRECTYSETSVYLQSTIERAA